MIHSFGPQSVSMCAMLHIESRSWQAMLEIEIGRRIEIDNEI